MNISNYISFEENIAIISGIVLNLSEDIKISFEENKIFVINREILNFAETKKIPNEMKMNLYETDGQKSGIQTALEVYALNYENKAWKDRRVHAENFTYYADKSIKALVRQNNVYVPKKEALKSNLQHLTPWTLQGAIENNKEIIVIIYYNYILMPLIKELQKTQHNSKSKSLKLSNFNDALLMGTEELIKLDEGQFLEFKENCYWLEDKELEKKELLKNQYKPGSVIDMRDTILKTICAFGNTDGGIILIGVIDKKNGGGVCGIDEDRKLDKLSNNDDFELFWKDLIKENIDKWSSQSTSIEFELVNNKEIAKFIVPPRKKEDGYCQTTYFGNKKIFIRNGGRTIQVDPIDTLKQFRDRF